MRWISRPVKFGFYYPCDWPCSCVLSGAGERYLDMTSKKDFTAEEWKVLSDAPLFVGGAVAASAPSGVVGTIKEGMAIVNSMRSTAQHHPNNQLIQEVVPQAVGRERVDVWLNAARGLLRQSESVRVMTAGMETCQKVAMILGSKGDPQEADEFKRWLLEIGGETAQAAKEGSSVSGNVSSEEAQILSTMSSTLGVTYIPNPPNPENYQHP